MKNFFCVTSEFYDDGTVTAKISVGRFIARPDNTEEKREHVHIYNDWHNTMQEARDYADRCRSISKAVRRTGCAR